MKLLKVRAHPIPKKARDGYVQLYLAGRWRANRGFYLGGHCPRCHVPRKDSTEFVQLEEDDAGADLIEASGVKPWAIAFWDVFAHCTACGRFQNTGYGYSPPGHAIPLASRKPRWPS